MLTVTFKDNNNLEEKKNLAFESRRQCLFSYLRSNSHRLFCDLSTSVMTQKIRAVFFFCITISLSLLYFEK